MCRPGIGDKHVKSTPTMQHDKNQVELVVGPASDPLQCMLVSTFAPNPVFTTTQTQQTRTSVIPAEMSGCQNVVGVGQQSHLAILRAEQAKHTTSTLVPPTLPTWNTAFHEKFRNLYSRYKIRRIFNFLAIRLTFLGPLKQQRVTQKTAVLREPLTEHVPKCSLMCLCLTTTT